VPNSCASDVMAKGENWYAAEFIIMVMFCVGIVFLLGGPARTCRFLTFAPTYRGV